ncbi:RNA-binding S4 domain-containing protein [Demequina sp.]|uniref:RNA-binding S4 domain-containing protein n=1 Tax=Demequina sp. TaxID=2050685 RepID=UPI0025FFB46C|nr:RNA-binding S4 domain-containing protein [Demequina sp.]
MATSVRVDAWVWAVRLYKTRSQATAGCRAGHVRIDGERAKPAQHVHVGSRVEVRGSERVRIVEVTQLLAKRVGAPVAAAAYIDHSPPPPPKELASPFGMRERGAGRPTKRQRREIDKLRGRRSR